MTTLRPRIVLSMIVKNESRVIKRCLRSVLPFVDAWCIVDTGSTDGTQDIIREIMHPYPGELLEQPWVREDQNRTQALQAATVHGDYILWIDADEEFVAEGGFDWPELTADTYDVLVKYGTVGYMRPQLLRAGLPWRWVGVIHPYLMAEGAGASQPLTGVHTLPHPDGASWADPDKYKKHAQLLEAELKLNPKDVRSWYYLGQSYRDAGMLDEALSAYRHRASMLGWPEETWSAAYEAAKLADRVGRPPAIVVMHYFDAWRARPHRAEPLYCLARYLRLRGEHQVALVYAREAARLPTPNDRLFVELDVYQWRALDELVLALHNTGAHIEALDLLQQLHSQAPASEAPRLAANEGFIRARVEALTAQG